MSDWAPAPSAPTLPASASPPLDAAGLIGFARSGLFARSGQPAWPAHRPSCTPAPAKTHRTAHRCPAPRTGPAAWPRPPRTGPTTVPTLPERPPRNRPPAISNDLHATALRATLCGMANDCPVLMVLLWCQSVNDDVQLHGDAPAAQGRESCLEWDHP